MRKLTSRIAEYSTRYILKAMHRESVRAQVAGVHIGLETVQVDVV